jgi:hypothetical protein
LRVATRTLGAKEKEVTEQRNTKCGKLQNLEIAHNIFEVTLRRQVANKKSPPTKNI